ncbi:MAG: Dabb family protein [Verrucomicrobia bacterium]|nr:Dabb family protein [Verrucomicrobiota bacterium]
MSKVKHIALVKFKDGTSEEQIDEIFEALLEVTENIEGVEDYVSGPNSSPETLNKGFTHGFIVTFHDAAARDGYLAHADHEQFKAKFLPLIDDIAVVDFEI